MRSDAYEQSLAYTEGFPSMNFETTMAHPSLSAEAESFRSCGFGRFSCFRTGFTYTEPRSIFPAENPGDKGSLKVIHHVVTPLAKIRLA